MAKKKKRMEYRYYEIPADTYVLPLLGKGWEQEYGVGIRDMLHFHNYILLIYQLFLYAFVYIYLTCNV